VEGAPIQTVGVVPGREHLGVDDGEDAVVDIVVVDFAGDAFLDYLVADWGNVFVDDGCEDWWVSFYVQ
jgi:hypothetical protein